MNNIIINDEIKSLVTIDNVYVLKLYYLCIFIIDFNFINT